MGRQIGDNFERGFEKGSAAAREQREGVDDELIALRKVARLARILVAGMDDPGSREKIALEQALVDLYRRFPRASEVSS